MLLAPVHKYVQSATLMPVRLLVKVRKVESGPRYLSQYSDSLRAGRYGDRISVVARFSAPVQTGPGALPSSCEMGIGSLSRGKAARAWH